MLSRFAPKLLWAPDTLSGFLLCLSNLLLLSNLCPPLLSVVGSLIFCLCSACVSLPWTCFRNLLLPEQPRFPTLCSPGPHSCSHTITAQHMQELLVYPWRFLHVGSLTFVYPHTRTWELMHMFPTEWTLCINVLEMIPENLAVMNAALGVRALC